MGRARRWSRQHAYVSRQFVLAPSVFGWTPSRAIPQLVFERLDMGEGCHSIGPLRRGTKLAPGGAASDRAASIDFPPAPAIAACTGRWHLERSYQEIHFICFIGNLSRRPGRGPES